MGGASGGQHPGQEGVAAPVPSDLPLHSCPHMSPDTKDICLVATCPPLYSWLSPHAAPHGKNPSAAHALFFTLYFPQVTGDPGCHHEFLMLLDYFGMPSYFVFAIFLILSSYSKPNHGVRWVTNLPLCLRRSTR